MKKFKNFKLMLLGLFCLMGVNAFALDNDYKTDGKSWYFVNNEAKGEVTFVGVSKTVAEPKEVLIPATVDLPDDDGVNKKTYKVIAASNVWWDGSDGAGHTRDMSAAPLESLTFEFRTDWDADMVVDGTAAVHSYDCLSVAAFQSSLKTLVIKEAHKVYTLPVLNAFTALEVLDLSGVSDDGAGIVIPANFVKDLHNLKSVELPEDEPLVIGANAFDGICGTTDGEPTEVEGIDLTNATSIGAEAFRNAYITEALIGENVSDLHPYAFVAPDMNKAYLTKVIWKSNKIMAGDPAQPQVKAAFPGQINIQEVVVEANKVTSIESGAFTACAPQGGDPVAPIPFVLDLSEADAMATIAGAIPNIPYGEIYLAGTALEGENLTAILGFDLSAKSKETLAVLTLPAGLEEIVEDEFKDYTALATIELDLDVPANAFNGCTSLQEVILDENVTAIGDYAFQGTGLTTITISEGVETIGKYAFADITAAAVTLDLEDAESLASLGEGVFQNTNIKGAVDFSNTEVYEIPAFAFAKSSEKKDLTSVTLKTGTASNKNSIGKLAFVNNVALATVTELNHANWAFNPTAGQYGINEAAFANTNLQKVELDKTPFTVIATAAFASNDNLASIKLNPATTKISEAAFGGAHALKTIDGLNQDKLQVIEDEAFAQSGLETLNLDAATSLTTIGERAFSAIRYKDATGKLVYTPTLTTITLPAETCTDPESTDKKFSEKYSNKITAIGEGAFLYQNKVTAFNNLKDTKISVLNELFTNVPAFYDATDSDTPTDGFAVGQDQTALCPAGLTTIELPSTVWYASDLTPSGIYLEEIADYALQGLGIEEIVIPSSVYLFGDCVLQGCINLKKVEWYDAQVTTLHKYTFRGDSNLEKFYYMTTAVIDPKGITDKHFYWCTKEKLTVYVTAESLNQLVADGYTTANALYSKLNDSLTDEITFTALNSADNMYYRTYFNKDYATWIEANDDIKVYTAAFNGAKVEMTEADIENGYYKIKRFDGTNADEAVCIIASKNPSVVAEFNALNANNVTTLKYKINELEVAPADFAASKLSFYFKLGKGPKGIAFYRITTGTFKKDVVYLQAADAARVLDFYPVSGEETGIEAIQENTDDNAPVYNLQGARVNNVKSGNLYIKNGKKYVK